MLVRNGFVERHTGETDARLRRLTLTEKSENLLADIRADHEAMEAVLTKGFTQNEKETMLTYLRRAKINVDAAFAEKQQKKERSGADG
jgi:DNA-binding MarR family transcriptional regulator